MAIIARSLMRYLDGTSWPFHVLACWVVMAVVYQGTIS
jgi:hypothetical protein